MPECVAISIGPKDPNEFSEAVEAVSAPTACPARSCSGRNSGTPSRRASKRELEKLEAFGRHEHHWGQVLMTLIPRGRLLSS